MSEEKPMKPDELGKFARPIADYLRSVMLDETRSPMERVQAALGISILWVFRRRPRQRILPVIASVGASPSPHP